MEGEGKKVGAVAKDNYDPWIAGGGGGVKGRGVSPVQGTIEYFSEAIKSRHDYGSTGLAGIKGSPN